MLLSEIENGTKRVINAYYRANDESHKWPICGKFNATERAIRRLTRDNLYPYGGIEYFLAIEEEITKIVNSEV